MGAFKISDVSNRNFHPRGKKACALLAMLFTAHGNTKARGWLADHLWSDRSNEQASGSLRQTLSEIRQALGEHKHLLTSDKTKISIDTSDIWIDAYDSEYIRKLTGSQAQLPEFLENVDIRDVEYEHWLTLQRNHFEGHFQKTDDRKPNLSNGLEVTKVSHQQTKGPSVIKNQVLSDSNTNLLFAEMVADILCGSLSDIASIRVFDKQELNEQGNDGVGKSILIDTKSFSFNSKNALGIVLKDSSDHRLLLNSQRHLQAGQQLSIESEAVLEAINEAVDLSISELAPDLDDLEETMSPAELSIRAVELLFTMSAENLQAAEGLLRKCYQLEPRGLYLAWLAYIRTIQLGEGVTPDGEAILEEMEELILQAIEKEPNNALVLSIAAYIHTVWLGEHDRAFELAERSLSLNPTSAIGLCYFGLTQSHLGNLVNGRDLTALASRIAGSGPHKAQLKQISFITTALAGDFPEAAQIGETVTADEDRFVANKRFLILLYDKLNEEEKLERVINELRIVDPTATVRSIKDRFRLNSVLRNSLLLK
ncbi:MAG: hypothetical protein V3V04_06020 [Rhizobiaceae bacterium]